MRSLVQHTDLGQLSPLIHMLRAIYAYNVRSQIKDDTPRRSHTDCSHLPKQKLSRVAQGELLVCAFVCVREHHPHCQMMKKKERRE